MDVQSNRPYVGTAHSGPFRSKPCTPIKKVQLPLVGSMDGGSGCIGTKQLETRNELLLPSLLDGTKSVAQGKTGEMRSNTDSSKVDRTSMVQNTVGDVWWIGQLCSRTHQTYFSKYQKFQSQEKM